MKEKLRKKLISILMLAFVLFSGMRWLPERYRWNYSDAQGFVVYTILVIGWVVVVWLTKAKKGYKYAFSIAMAVYIIAGWIIILRR